MVTVHGTHLLKWLARCGVPDDWRLLQRRTQIQANRDDVLCYRNGSCIVRKFGDEELATPTSRPALVRGERILWVGYTIHDNRLWWNHWALFDGCGNCFDGRINAFYLGSSPLDLEAMPELLDEILSAKSWHDDWEIVSTEPADAEVVLPLPHGVPYRVAYKQGLINKREIA